MELHDLTNTVKLFLRRPLGVTFPFNVLLGIPLYYRLALLLHGAGG